MEFSSCWDGITISKQIKGLVFFGEVRTSKEEPAWNLSADIAEWNAAEMESSFYCDGIKTKNGILMLF